MKYEAKRQLQTVSISYDEGCLFEFVIRRYKETQCQKNCVSNFIFFKIMTI